MALYKSYTNTSLESQIAWINFTLKNPFEEEMNQEVDYSEAFSQIQLLNNFSALNSDSPIVTQCALCQISTDLKIRYQNEKLFCDFFSSITPEFFNCFLCNACKYLDQISIQKGILDSFLSLARGFCSFYGVSDRKDQFLSFISNEYPFFNFITDHLSKSNEIETQWYYLSIIESLILLDDNIGRFLLKTPLFSNILNLEPDDQRICRAKAQTILSFCTVSYHDYEEEFICTTYDYCLSLITSLDDILKKIGLRCFIAFTGIWFGIFERIFKDDIFTCAVEKINDKNLELSETSALLIYKCAVTDGCPIAHFLAQDVIGAAAIALQFNRLSVTNIILKTMIQLLQKSDDTDIPILTERLIQLNYGEYTSDYPIESKKIVVELIHLLIIHSTSKQLSQLLTHETFQLILYMGMADEPEILPIIVDALSYALNKAPPDLALLMANEIVSEDLLETLEDNMFNFQTETDVKKTKELFNYVNSILTESLKLKKMISL